ncbi:MAG: hypothetical protein J6V90_12660 [Treponema sp.]|nr:hypothetical protein [Treponema sp.]
MRFFFFCASCSNINEGDGKVTLKDQEQYYPATTAAVKSRSVNILIAGAGGSFASKSVLPKETIDIDDLTFVLKTVDSEDNASCKLLSGGVSTAGGLQYSLDIAPSIYDFFLFAYKTSDITSAGIVTSNPATAGQNIVNASDVGGGNKIFAAYKSSCLAQDFSESKTVTLTFELSSRGLNGYGTIKIGGAYVDAKAVVYGIKVYVSNIDTGEVVMGRDPLHPMAPTRSYYENVILTPQASTSSDPSLFSAPDFYVPAGSYRLVVALYADKVCSYQIGYWSDFVIVEPANVSEKLDIFINRLNGEAWN